MTVDNGWKALGQVNEWIRFADAKAGAVLAASGVLGGLLVRRIPRLADFKDHPAYAGLLMISIICVGGAAFIALRILAPKLRTGEARSLIYFDHVARRYATDRNGFVDNFTVLTADEGRFERHLAEQMWANSQVARAKFRRVTFAIYLLGAAMLASGASVVVNRLGIG